MNAPQPVLAIFLHQLTATGVVRNALAIGRHMRDHNWRVVIVTVRPGGELAALLDGLEHVVLGSSRLPRKLELLCAVGALRRTIEALGPQVVLSAGNHAHLAVLSAAQPQMDTAFVYRISNDLTHGIRADDRFATLSPRRLIAQRVVRDATRLVLVSPHLAQDPILAPALKDGRACVIPNGVDVDVVYRRAQEPCDHPWAGQDVPIVLAVGRLARQKNMSTLLKAFAIARRERELRLIIVGGGKQKARKKLEDLATGLGVADDVAFVGRVGNPFPYFRVASVLAMPSVWEGSPNVLLEALACRVPVVASRSAGNAEEILDYGRYGLLIDPRDADGLAEAILAQLDPERRVEPGDRAAMYDRPKALAQYQRLFEELVADRLAKSSVRAARS